ncbi:DUF1049 domain-containing protein [Prauserella sp. PE36]|uniref:LapA family protein n=1 Tax=Prauserella endophytica TaxID=1592324 RepID=A0ABY2S273_9PSEU|nr:MULTISPECIES: LapA family protein [Prauserella]RBM23531.1 DUF1049 domain-containing protein [Prauserella sp. PE36]TKG69251.1 LapA family protein [Prauserella endophytica]
MTAKPDVPGKRRFQLSPGRVIALVVAVVVVVFVVQNRDTVDMHLFTVVITGPLWTALLIVAALGVLTGYLLTRRR